MTTSKETFNDAETTFYNSLRDVFVGAKVEGISGFVNLMNIKNKYFVNISQIIKKDVEERLQPFPEFKHELYEKLYSFLEDILV